MTVAGRLVPALAKTWSIAPNFSLAILNMSSCCFHDVTSTLANVTWDASGSGMGLTSEATTLAPLLRRRLTVARPIPEEEPDLRVNTLLIASILENTTSDYYNLIFHTL